jgi:hypothetical protein
MTKERVKKSEEDEQLQEISDAIGDRRVKDLLDIVALLEQTEGWTTALQFLAKAKESKYSGPIGTGGHNAIIESLKYREVVFDLFSCRGFEPITVSTTEFLKTMREETSFASATQMARVLVEDAAIEQISSGDTLFFNFEDPRIFVSDDLRTKIDQVLYDEIEQLTLNVSGNRATIRPLWFTELGRRALLEGGISGYEMESDILDAVLSVIPVPPDTKTRIIALMNHEVELIQDHYPSNKQYSKLLEFMIEQNEDGLLRLGSRHAMSCFRTLLYGALDYYNKTKSSNSYRQIISSLNGLVTIRSLNTIMILEELINSGDQRLATPAVFALGNFYHESSLHALIQFVCSKRYEEAVNASIKAIKNLHKKKPQFEYILEEALQKECTNLGKLKRLYQQISRKPRE